MKKFNAPESSIHVLVRALLLQGEQIVLCRAKGEEWFFLPGGHVENGEMTRTALLRELGEEIGSYDYTIGDFAGFCEGYFPCKDDLFQHEINIVFEVRVPAGEPIQSKEDHIEFVCVERGALKECVILPNRMKEGIIEWLDRKAPFAKEFQE